MNDKLRVKVVTTQMDGYVSTYLYSMDVSDEEIEKCFEENYDPVPEYEISSELVYPRATC